MDPKKINWKIKLSLICIKLVYFELITMNNEVAIWTNSLENLLIFKKSSINPVRLKGSKKTKFTWSKILLTKMLAKINDKPPPLGFITLWELLSLGISGINFLKGLMNNLVKNQLKMKLENITRVIFKVNFI